MELKAKDLRIGNWVTLIKQNIYENKDYQLDAYDIYKASEFDDITECLLPIPLTEEWLIKFGWGKDKDLDNTYCNNIALEQAVLLYNLEYKLFTLETNTGDVVQIKVEHVHQLQNLYHSLTGQELQIIK